MTTFTLGRDRRYPLATHAQYYCPTHPHSRANGRGFLIEAWPGSSIEASHTHTQPTHTPQRGGPVPAQAFEEGLRHALRNAEGHQIESLLKHLAIENGCCLRVRGCRRIGGGGDGGGGGSCLLVGRVSTGRVHPQECVFFCSSFFKIYFLLFFPSCFPLAGSPTFLPPPQENMEQQQPIVAPAPASTASSLLDFMCLMGKLKVLDGAPIPLQRLTVPVDAVVNVHSTRHVWCAIAGGPAQKSHHPTLFHHASTFSVRVGSIGFFCAGHTAPQAHGMGAPQRGRSRVHRRYAPPSSGGARGGTRLMAGGPDGRRHRPHVPDGRHGHAVCRLVSQQGAHGQARPRTRHGR